MQGAIPNTSFKTVIPHVCAVRLTSGFDAFSYPNTYNSETLLRQNHWHLLCLVVSGLFGSGEEF